MKCLLQDMDVLNKRVIVRCDFNVPLKDGHILDDTKIKASLETINYLIEKNCKIILLSHMGKVKTLEDKKEYSLKVVAERLNELVSSNVIFSPETRSSLLEIKAMELQPKDILLVENTRFEDIDNGFESNDDMQLASYFASLGDIFVLDAFASAHRKHASTYGITKFIPSCLGFLVQREMEMLNKYVLNAPRPFVIIMGGAKIDDKLALVSKLLPKCDHMLLAGGLANSALKSLGLSVGSSLVSESVDTLENVKKILKENSRKIILPFDAIVGNKYDENSVVSKDINKILADEVIGDVGPKTLGQYRKVLADAKTIFMNGTLGMYEDKRYSNGTLELLELLKGLPATKIAGGGDCTSAIDKFGYQKSFDFISTGGGATLEYIMKGTLPAIEAINDAEEVL